jgi:hypothetical protein
MAVGSHISVVVRVGTLIVVTPLKIIAAPAGSTKAPCATKNGSASCASYLGCVGAWCGEFGRGTAAGAMYCTCGEVVGAGCIKQADSGWAGRVPCCAAAEGRRARQVMQVVAVHVVHDAPARREGATGVEAAI